MSALGIAESYLLNSLWQVPLLLGIGWAAARLSRRAGIQTEHRIWVSIQLLAAVLPAVSSLPGSWHELTLPWFARGYEAADGTIAVQMGQGAGTLASGFGGVALLSAVMLYGVITLFLCLRYAWRVRRAWKLSRDIDARIIPNEVGRMWQESCDRMQVKDVTLAIAESIFAPVTCGVTRKVVLLPACMINAVSDSELRAAFIHELGHARRNDFALNLLYELLSLPVSYHPAAWAIRQRVTETREMICDSIAADACGAAEYGRSLLSLANRLLNAGPVRYPHAIGVFDANTLERRVMRLKSDFVLLRGVRRNVVTIACALLVGVAAAAAAAAGLHAPASSYAEAEGAARHTVSPGEMQRLLINHVFPVYPPEAKKAHIQGTVVLRAVIATDGAIDQLTVVSGPKELQQSSLDAVRQWRYKPYVVDGEPVEVETTVNVIYTLAK